MPVISSPTRSWYSSNIMSRSASRMRWRITCLAVWAAMRPKSSGVTSRSSIWSRYCIEPLRVELGLLRLAHLARLGVDRRLAGLLLDLGEQLLLEVGRQQQLEDAEVAAVAVHVDARVLGRARASSCRPTGARPRAPSIRRSAEMPFSRSRTGRPRRSPWTFRSPSSRLLRLMSAYGIDTTPSSAATVTSSSLAPTSSPVKLLCPSRGSRVRTRARRPRKRRKWSGLVSGRSGPGRGDLERSSRSSRSRSWFVTRSQSARSTPVGVVDRRGAGARAPTLLAGEHLDLRLGAREALLDVGLKWLIGRRWSYWSKKRWAAKPTFRRGPRAADERLKVLAVSRV